MGGVFMLDQGRAKYIVHVLFVHFDWYDTVVIQSMQIWLCLKCFDRLHIMPDFSACPLETDADVDRWLHFYEANAPLVNLSVFISSDPVGAQYFIAVQFSTSFNTADRWYVIKKSHD